MELFESVELREWESSALPYRLTSSMELLVYETMVIYCFELFFSSYETMAIYHFEKVIATAPSGVMHSCSIHKHFDDRNHGLSELEL
jgi:hypothetical protein